MYILYIIISLTNTIYIYRILGRVIRIDYMKDDDFNETSDMKLHSELLPFVNDNKVTARDV
jgi:hypothetical protein